MSELTQQRLEIREAYRQRMMDIISRRAVVEVVEPHSNILPRTQMEPVDE